MRLSMVEGGFVGVYPRDKPSRELESGVMIRRVGDHERNVR